MQGEKTREADEYAESARPPDMNPSLISSPDCLRVEITSAQLFSTPLLSFTEFKAPPPQIKHEF
jgi:hypothetical protein